MKTALITLIISFVSICVYSQDITGPVLKKEISGKYEGELKKGLAHGNGTAIGQDTYTGHFSKGLPDGDGTYTFGNGDIYKGAFSKGLFSGKGILLYRKASGDSIVEGYWQGGKYVGKTIVDPYEISNKTGSANPSISRIGDGNKVEIVVMDPFNAYINPQIIPIGEFTLETYYSRNLFNDAKFPISFDIRYSCSNKIRTGIIDSTVKIKINKPGNWLVTIRN
jgi:hypothetical protein